MFARDLEVIKPDTGVVPYLFNESLYSALSKLEAILLSNGSFTDPLLLSNLASS